MTKAAPDSAAWKAVRARLAKAAKAIDAPFEMAPEQAAALLEERARLLAEPLQADEPEGAEHVVFTLAGTRYALPSSSILTVSRLAALVAVPGLPDAFLGITNWRGLLIPVIDLRIYLDLPRSRRAQAGWLIVLGHDSPELGVVAESIEELAVLQVDGAAKQPEESGQGRLGSIRGVTRERIVLLDAAALVGDPHLHVGQSDPSIT